MIRAVVIVKACLTRVRRGTEHYAVGMLQNELPSTQTQAVITRVFEVVRRDLS
jgi:hypothetical protein